VFPGEEEESITKEFQKGLGDVTAVEVCLDRTGRFDRRRFPSL